MNKIALVKTLLNEVQEHLAAGKRDQAEKAVLSCLQELFEQAHGEELFIQVDLNCGEFQNVWVNAPHYREITVLVTEDPSVVDDTGEDIISVDDDRAVMTVTEGQLMNNIEEIIGIIDAYTSD